MGSIADSIKMTLKAKIGSYLRQQRAEFVKDLRRWINSVGFRVGNAVNDSRLNKEIRLYLETLKNLKGRFGCKRT